VVTYALNTEGKKFIELWNEGAMNLVERYEFRNFKWDNKWHFLNIDFPKDKNDSKAEVIDNLEQYRFAQINTNTWVTPYHQYEKILKLIKDYNLSDGIIETHGEMTIHKDMNTFLDEVFSIKKLKPLYEQFISIYSDKLIETKQIYKESDFVNAGLALPILHELGTHFFNIASDDTVLPKQILPEWEGDKAAVIMKNLREMLLEAAYEYFKKFD
jgi:phenylacetic acid degradation operon negative regulatory protein